MVWFNYWPFGERALAVFWLNWNSINQKANHNMSARLVSARTAYSFAVQAASTETVHLTLFFPPLLPEPTIIELVGYTFNCLIVNALN